MSRRRASRSRARAPCNRGKPAFVAVLEGGLENPRVIGTIRPQSGDRQAASPVHRRGAAQSDGGAAREAVHMPVLANQHRNPRTERRRPGPSRRAAGQSLLFLLTLLLAGMLLSQLIEEKSNKVIEVLAAAVPIDAIFLGKLLAMLSASLAGIAVWSSVGVGAPSPPSLPPASGALRRPAVGWPTLRPARRRLFRDELFAARRHLPRHRRAMRRAPARSRPCRCR